MGITCFFNWFFNCEGQLNLPSNLREDTQTEDRLKTDCAIKGQMLLLMLVSPGSVRRYRLCQTLHSCLCATAKNEYVGKEGRLDFLQLTQCCYWKQG